MKGYRQKHPYLAQIFYILKHLLFSRREAH